MSKYQFKKGGVSIFVVIFTTILLGVIALGFIRLMILDQQRAINSDLSNSALDSAMAGVADAKRAIIKYEREICGDGASGINCSGYLDRYLNGENCDAASAILYNKEGEEVPISTDESGDLAQAYTCAKIKYFTDDYVRDLREEAGEQIIIPLNFTNDLSSLTLDWHTKDDMASGSYSLSSIDKNNPTWKTSSAWGNAPPVLMLQFIQKGKSDAPTIFLAPSTGVNNAASFSADSAVLTTSKTPPVFPVGCSPSSARPYKCNVTLNFGTTISARDRNSFLRITKIYNSKTTISFKPTLDTGSGKQIFFNGIQPEIDVTGRANYIFRRLKARVEFTGGLFPYPTAALSVGGDICKSFEVTDYKLKNDSSFSPQNDSDEECIID